MKNILDQIIAQKHKEVSVLKEMNSIDQLTKSSYFNDECKSLKSNLKSELSSGIIAEFKRQSPSKGIINGTAKPEEVAEGYKRAGVSAMSILTDTQFFGGGFQDFAKVRKAVDLPLLRKDFIIDEYQVYETKSYGADIMLLIAANLELAQCQRLAAKAKELGLEVLLELHVEEELEYINDDIDLVGINNRNLKTFIVDLEHSIRLAEKIPDSFVKIAESGISDVENIRLLKSHGFKGFLIGETFMKTDDPGKTCEEFIKSI